MLFVWHCNCCLPWGLVNTLSATELERASSTTSLQHNVATRGEGNIAGKPAPAKHATKCCNKMSKLVCPSFFATKLESPPTPAKHLCCKVQHLCNKVLQLAANFKAHASELQICFAAQCCHKLQTSQQLAMSILCHTLFQCLRWIYTGVQPK